MADSKVQNLVKRTINSLASITGVRIWSGKTGEVDALGIELPDLLYSNPVNVAASSIDYVALTPMGFYNSTMDTSKNGVGMLASTVEITEKTGSNLLTASNQSTMQSQWKKDWFEKNGIPSLYAADDLNLPWAMSFDFNYSISSMPASTEIAISPVLPTYRIFQALSISFAANYSNGGAAASGFVTLKYTGGIVRATLIHLPVNVYLSLSADGRQVSLSLWPTGNSGSLRVSGHINAVLGV